MALPSSQSAPMNLGTRLLPKRRDSARLSSRRVSFVLLETVVVECSVTTRSGLLLRAPLHGTTTLRAVV